MAQPVANLKSSEHALATAMAVETAEEWTASEQAVAAVAANEVAVAIATSASCPVSNT